jgi:hypothetical protein
MKLISFDFFKINDTPSIKSTSNGVTKDIFLNFGAKWQLEKLEQNYFFNYFRI